MSLASPLSRVNKFTYSLSHRGLGSKCFICCANTYYSVTYIPEEQRLVFRCSCPHFLDHWERLWLRFRPLVRPHRKCISVYFLQQEQALGSGESVNLRAWCEQYHWSGIQNRGPSPCFCLGRSRTQGEPVSHPCPRGSDLSVPRAHPATT